MKRIWMNVGVLGVAATTLIGCAEKAMDTTVVVEPNIGTVHQRDQGPGDGCFESDDPDSEDAPLCVDMESDQTAGDVCFQTNNDGAAQWINQNCDNGGTYAYQSNAPDGEHCMRCGGGGGATGTLPGDPPSTDPGTGNPGPGGGGGVTLPIPPDAAKPMFLCSCCDGTAEWVDSTDRVSSDLCGGAGIVGCTPFAMHPAVLDTLATDETVLGDTATFWKIPGDSTTEIDALGDTLTKTTYWAHLNDGDTVRMFLQILDEQTDGVLGEIAGNLPVPWVATLGVEAMKLEATADTKSLLAAYNTEGFQEGVIIQSDETWDSYTGDEHLPGMPLYSEFPGEMRFHYSIYLRQTGALLGTIDGSFDAMQPGGHYGITPVPGKWQYEKISPFMSTALAGMKSVCDSELAAAPPPPPNGVCSNGLPPPCDGYMN